MSIKTTLLRFACVLMAIVSISLASARDLDGQGGCQIGGYIYSAQVPCAGAFVPVSSGLRVSKLSTSGAVQWVKDIPAPSGWNYVPETFTADQSMVCVDQNGFAWAVTLLQNAAGAQEFQINLLNSSGTLQSTHYYSPGGGTLGRPFGIANVYGSPSQDQFFLVSNYQPTAGSGKPSTGIISMWNASGLVSNSPIVVGSPIDSSQHNVYVDDVVYDPVRNYLYVSGCSTPNSMQAYPFITVNAYTIGSSISLQRQFQANLPYGINPHYGSVDGRLGTGFLSVDSNNLGSVTYVTDTGNSTQSNTGYYLQISSAAVGLYQAGSLTFSPVTSLTDANGDLVLVSTPGNTYSTWFTVTKLSGANLGSTVWSYNNSNANYTHQPTSIAQDAGGDYLVTEFAVSAANGNVAAIDRFTESTGVWNEGYVFSSNPNDRVSSVFPTSTSGVFYAVGSGQSSGTGPTYAMCGEFNGSYLPSWVYYSTTTH